MRRRGPGGAGLLALIAGFIGCRETTSSSESVASASAPSIEGTTVISDADPKRPADPSGPWPPLSSEIRAWFETIRSDPPPPRLVRDTHYWISNEQSHFVWYEAVADIGHALVGVATDQNYLLAGWARSQWLILVDFDGQVADLHRIYGVFFEDAATPDEFVALWGADRQAAMEAKLGAMPYADKVAALREVFVSARERVESRLRAIQVQYRARGIPTFVTDAGQYAHVRALWRAGRVTVLHGDLTGDVTMLDVADALRASGQSVGVLYLSNAEQYFRYRPRFRRNIIALPMASNGVVLRTHGWPQFGYVDGEEYHYNRQPASLFAQWMANSRVWGVPAMLEQRTQTGPVGVSVLDHPPLRDEHPSVADRPPH